MSGLDIFAWIVLIIVAISTIGVVCIAGWLPGHIARTRGHPWAQAVTVAGWITLFYRQPCHSQGTASSAGDPELHPALLTRRPDAA